MRAALLQRKCGCGRPSGAAEECADRAAAVARVVASPGRPLDPAVRIPMESSFGRSGGKEPKRSAAGVARAPLEIGRTDDPLEIHFRLFDKHPQYLTDRDDPLDEQGEIVWREGGGVALITEGTQHLDFTFTPADAGTLHFVIRMFDPDTSSLLEFEDSIALQPTGSGGGGQP